MEQYSVARMTVRQALSSLIGEGLAVSRKGAGVFVRTFRPIVRNGIARLASERWGSGRTIWSADAEGRSLNIDQLTVDEVRPPDHVATLLKLDDDARTVRRSRRFVLDGKPVLLSVAYIPAGIASGTAIAEENTGPGGTYARLTDLGYAPNNFREDLRARMPLAAEAGRLVLDSATPVVDILRVAYTKDWLPVEVNEMIADSSAYIFRYEFAG